MRATIKIVGILVGTSITIACTIAPAMANTNDVTANVTAGNLTATTTDVTLSRITLDGKTLQHATGTPATAWSITDARGSSAAWALSVSGTDFTSPAGSIDTTPRVIEISKLTITPGTITAGAGSDPAPTASPLTLSTSPQSLIATSGAGMGTYSFTPGFDLSVPANSFRSNFSAAVGTTAINPYVSVLTYTVA